MRAEALKKMNIFSETDIDILNRFLATHQIYAQRYSKSMTVYNIDDKCNTLDIVLSGSLVAYSLSENGSAMTMFEFSGKSIIGANLLFGDNNKYPLSIYCLSDCELLHITRKAVSECLHDYNFVMHYVRSLSLNSQSMNRRITMITQKTLRENILKYLWQQSIKQNSSNIVLPMSKKELADYLGVQRPSLFRELKKMKDENIIDIENRRIKILKNKC